MHLTLVQNCFCLDDVSDPQFIGNSIVHVNICKNYLYSSIDKFCINVTPLYHTERTYYRRTEVVMVLIGMTSFFPNSSVFKIKTRCHSNSSAT